MALMVSTPQFQQDGKAASLLVAEKQITLSCNAVTFADGTPLTVLNQPTATFLIYRLLFGGVQQVFDTQGKTWTTPSPSVTPQKMFWNDKAQSWQALIMAIGNKDSTGNDTFGSVPTTGFPKYVAQCSFTGTDISKTNQSGQSPLSAPVEILAPGQNNLAGLSMDPNDPTKATEIELFLKDGAFVEQGRVVISQDSAGFHVQLFAGGSSVVLSSSGEIVLTPSPVKAVQVIGDLRVSGNLFVGATQMLVP